MPVTFPERLKQICSEKGIAPPTWQERAKYGSIVAQEYFSASDAPLLPKKKYAEQGVVMEIMQYPDEFAPILDRLIEFLIHKRPDKKKRQRKTYAAKPVRSYRLK
jgi:hypothetical protein